MAEAPKKKKTMRHASGVKALRQSWKHADQNRQVRSSIRTAAQRVVEAVAAKNAPEAQKRLSEASSAWARAAHRHVIHQNAASRKIERLSRLVHALGR